MPIFYNKTERGNPGNPAAPKRWYPVLKSTGLIKEREVAKLLSDVNVRFSESTDLKNALAKATFKDAKTMNKK